MNKKTQLLMGLIFAASFGKALAAEPKIAVTDLTYEEKVSQYFKTVTASSKSSVKASSSEHENDFGSSSRDRLSAKNESYYHSDEGTYTYIDRGELHTYTADLKGAMIKGGGLRLVQARPYVAKPMEKIYDIIGRIKQGLYPGADYVLFGTVSNIDFRQENMQLAQGTSNMANLTLDLVVDFSLINTRTYEVKAAFSATGTGQDTKILTHAGDRVVLNRSKVIADTSKSLANAAYDELMTQLGMPHDSPSANDGSGRNAPVREQKVEPVTVYR